MNLIYRTCGVLIILGLFGGCASLQTPSADLAARIPTIEMGQPKPEGNEYILFVPAGKDVPVKLIVGGSFLSKEGTTETAVQLRRDLYLYQRWASFDGKRWEPSHGVFEVLISASMDSEGGKVEVKVDESN